MSRPRRPSPAQPPAPAPGARRRYRYIEGISTADVAFEAFGVSLEDLLAAAADAVLGVMVEAPDSVEPRQSRTIELSASTEEMLLFELLNELVYLKDAEGILLRVTGVVVRRQGGELALTVSASGEPFDPARHRPLVDVKAATLHHLELSTHDGGWRAVMVLDV